jgi:uncharacterized RDD family membrane protein YckC
VTTNRAPTRLQRALAFLMDATPGWLVVWVGAGPALRGLSLLALEEIFGVGIYDPRVGHDPVLFAHAALASRLALRSLVVTGVWTAAQAAMAAFAGASVGKLALGLRVTDIGGDGPAPRRRRVLREIARETPAAGAIAMSGVFALWREALPLFCGAGLMVALALVAAGASAVRVLRSGAARSWLDIVARTVVLRR